MDPSDRPRPLPDGASCTACGAPVPTGRIRILAHRDDVAFVEFDCAACGSATLGLLIGPAVAGGTPTLDLAAEDPTGLPAGDGPASRPAAASPTYRPITEADVEAVRRDLAAWDGDLVGWLDALDRGDRRGSVVDR